MKKLITLLVIGATASITHAQINMTATNTPSVITFDSDIAGTVLLGTGDNNTSVSEPDSGFASGAASGRPNLIITTGASGRFGFTNGGNPYNFGADSNGNSNSTDLLHFGNVIGIKRPTDNATNVEWISTWGDLTELSNNAFAMTRDGDFANGGFYLRIQNNTGSTVTDWEFASDVFYKEDDNNMSTFTWGYSITNATDISAMTFTDLGATTTIENGDTLADAQAPLSASVNTAGVANGDFIVLAFEDASGDGSTILLDNISVTAVPEPSTLVLFGMFAASMLILRRRILR